MIKKKGAVIASAGSGSRMGITTKKQYLKLDNKMIIQHTLDKFVATKRFDQIVLVCDRENKLLLENLIKQSYSDNNIKILEGSDTRTKSVFKGITALDKDTQIVAIHDGVRPLINQEIIHRSLDMLQNEKKQAVVVCAPAIDTIKVATDNVVIKTLDRKSLWHAQTPQCFQYELLLECMMKAIDSKMCFTDEASIIEYYGYPVHICPNPYINQKITTQDDLDYVEFLLKRRGEI